MLIEWIKLVRPHQWIKNGFIFASLFFSFKFSVDKILLLIIGFFLFSAAASAIYIFNDYHDIAEDREHPVKKNRPLASGKINKKSALVAMIVLITTSLACGFFLSIPFTSILCLYLTLNFAYTLKIKHISILDISIIAVGFVLRIIAGSILVEIETSMWIILVTFLLALFLAMAKRRDDCLLALAGQKTRKNIDGYNLEMVNAAMILLAGVTIVSYIMYTITPEVVERIGSNKLFLTTFFVIIGILRYMQITFVEMNSGSPTAVVLKDRFLQGIIISWLISFGLIHYL